ncbi:MAG: retropepsin-like aspartic protease [Bacteroidota bacterium]
MEQLSRFQIGIPLLAKNVEIFGPDGSLKIDLILDTGAAFTCLSWFVLESLGYNPAIVRTKQEIITANGNIFVPKISVQKIKLGNAETNSIDVICHDIPEFAEIEGLLGLNFLKHFRTTLDYKAGYYEII